MNLKKILGVLLALIILTSGCGKKTTANVVEDYAKKVNETTSYILKGNMEIYAPEETFTYSLEVDFLKDNFYKVKMVNQTNNHEQIILRNKDAVYVITPSLNKSFKFQSEWPNNSSQSYLLGPIVDDLNNDEEILFEEKDGLYVLTTEVNYPNNEELTYEKLFFNDDSELKQIEVYNNDDNLMIKVVFTEIDYKANWKKEDFNLDNLIDEDCCGEVDTETGALEDIIYPLYIPSNTYLKSKETISVDNGERAILTFAGDKNFVLVEEATKANNEFEIIPIYGEPLMMGDTVAAISANSLSWTSNNIDYYLASNDLSNTELMSIANSLNNTGSYVGK